MADYSPKDYENQNNYGQYQPPNQYQQEQHSQHQQSKLQEMIDNRPRFFLRPKKPISEWKKTKTLMWELFGSAILAYGICSASGPEFVTMTLAGALLFTLPFSGGHLNPAISFAFFIKGEIGPFDFLFRCIGQLVGAFIGAFFSFLVLDKISGPVMNAESYEYTLDGEEGYTEYMMHHWGALNACLGEIVGTFLFSYGVLLMTDKLTTLHKGNNPIMTIVAIVLTFHISRQMTFRSGGCLNPGLGFILTLWRAVFQGELSVLAPLWVYIFAPFIGAFIGGIYYNWIHYPLATNQAKREQKFQEDFKLWRQKVLDYQENTLRRQGTQPIELVHLKKPLISPQQQQQVQQEQEY